MQYKKPAEKLIIVNIVYRLRPTFYYISVNGHLLSVLGSWKSPISCSLYSIHKTVIKSVDWLLRPHWWVIKNVAHSFERALAITHHCTGRGGRGPRNQVYPFTDLRLRALICSHRFCRRVKKTPSSSARIGRCASGRRRSRPIIDHHSETDRRRGALIQAHVLSI